MRRAVSHLTLVVVFALVASACASGSGADGSVSEFSGTPLTGAVNVVSLDDGTTVAVGREDRAANLVASKLDTSVRPAGPDIPHNELDFLIDISDPDGDQPDGVVELTIPSDAISFSNPEAVSIASWDSDQGQWVPQHTSWDPSSEVFVARIRHFSPIAGLEFIDVVDFVGERADDVGEFVADEASAALDGLARTGAEVRAYFNQAAVYRETIDAFLASEGRVLLDLDVSEMPECGESPADFVLNTTVGLLGPDAPVLTCLAEVDGQPLVRMVNNRPFGLTVEVPSGSTFHAFSVERGSEYAELPLSGEDALGTFFDVFFEQLRIDDAVYLPPRASLDVLLDFPTDGTAAQRIEISSFIGFVGVDIAFETALFLPSKGVQASIDIVLCISDLGGALQRVNDDESELFQDLINMGDCLAAVGADFLKFFASWIVETLQTVFGLYQFSEDGFLIENQIVEVSSGAGQVLESTPCVDRWDQERWEQLELFVFIEDLDPVVCAGEYTLVRLQHKGNFSISHEVHGPPGFEQQPVVEFSCASGDDPSSRSNLSVTWEGLTEAGVPEAEAKSLVDGFGRSDCP